MSRFAQICPKLPLSNPWIYLSLGLGAGVCARLFVFGLVAFCSLWGGSGFAFALGWVCFGSSLCWIGFGLGWLWVGLGLVWVGLGLVWVWLGLALVWIGSGLGWIGFEGLGFGVLGF